MKKYIQLTLASIVAVIGVALTAPLTQPTKAIDVFSGACGSGSGNTTGNTGASAGNGALSGQTPSTSEGTAEGTGSTNGKSTSICGAASQDDAQDIIKNVINAILVVLGMAAVIMIIIGGIRYTTSNGDASSVKGAKDTILYAVVGLVIAILSYAIVNFVLGRFS